MLGDLPGGVPNSTYANAISADSDIIVGQALNASSNWEAFLWTSAGGMVGLGDLAGGQFNSSASGISGDGQVIVGYGTTGPLFFDNQAFRWTSGGGMVGLGYLSGGIRSYANGASYDGSVVVGSSSNGTTTEAFLWTSAGGMVGLGFASGHVSSSASSTSADGSTVVGSGYTGTYNEAVRWTSATGMQSLGVLSGRVSSQAYQVSNDGAVVIGTSYTSGNVASAFRWTSGSGMVDLGTMSSGTGLFDDYDVRSMSSDGSIILGIAGGGLGYNENGNRFFIWDSVNGMRDLFDILESDFGHDTSDWFLDSAFPELSISADGQSITGRGYYAGVTRSFIFTIPEPSSVMMAIAGGLGLAALAKRRLRG